MIVMSWLTKIGASLLVSLPSLCDASGLNLYLWEDTLSKQIIHDWQNQSGTALNLFHFDNDDERSLLMLKSFQLPFDIIVLDNVSAQIFARQNKFEDLSALPGRENIASRWNQVCGSHAVPYFWGSVGILYRKNHFKTPPKKWSDLIRPTDHAKKHVGLIQDSIETLYPILNTLDKNPTTDNVDDLKTAYQQMEKINPNILTYEYALSYVRSHKNSNDLYMALAYSGDQNSLNRYFKTDNWGFITPKGTPYIWVDCMAINSNSKLKKQAKALLSYLMRPEVAAQNALDIGAATPNKKALSLLPKRYLQDTSIFPAPNRMKHVMIDQELSPQNLNIRAKIIHSLTTQHEAQP